jgi:hypothetical protein
MQTWIKANIGKLKERMTAAEDAISSGTAYTNDSDLDSRTTALETAVGMPYTSETNISSRITNIENAMCGLSVWTGTESEYAALSTYDANTLYYCYADPTNQSKKSKKKE